VRTRSDAVALVGAIRAQVRAVDPGIPVHDVQPLHQLLAESLAAPRFSAALLVAFSIAALLLAAIGIYGVISYAAAMRTREIGVRMALGARPADAIRLVIGHALRLAGGGVLVGALAALAFTRFLRSQLFGVSATDPVTMIATAAFLMLIAAIAGWAPAWRASRVDPLHALRHE
jgi:ABC-type antimicrobial peptide transport system permease subunit